MIKWLGGTLLTVALCGIADPTAGQSPGRTDNSNGPAFVLLGTTRIGDRYSALLRAVDGSQVLVASDGAGPTPIEGFSDFNVTSIGSKRVLIQRPASMPCVAYPALGVGCEGNYTSTLQLRARVLEQVGGATAVQPELTVERSLEAIPAEAGSFIEAIQEKAEARGEKPEVPPGMQLLETSSGYRLIPED